MIPHSRLGVEQAEEIAVGALAYLAGDPHRLTPFLAQTGLRPDTIRAAAASPGFLLAVLDHVAAHEALLVDLARSLEIAPERIMEARHVLSPARPQD